VKHRALRQAQRLADRQRFARAGEIRRIARAEHYRTNERTVGCVHDHAVAGRAAVGRDQPHVTPQRLQRPACIAGRAIDGQRVLAPRLARLANGKDHSMPARRVHPESQRRAAQQLGGRILDARARQQLAAPGVDRSQHGAQAVTEQRRGARQYENPGASDASSDGGTP